MEKLSYTIPYLTAIELYYLYQEDKEYKVYIYNHVREEEYTLYGFRTEQERDMFLRLINVKGSSNSL